ncbi:MAG: hypothetical protein O7B99_07385 [Planctomycetota bacterium]|nr:hypothetical protein [Planctomycetota bacterium]
MPEAIATYFTRVSGVWNTAHVLHGDNGALGTLTVRRNKASLVVGGDYRPEKGEAYTFRRDPGLLRSHFSMWTDQQEWLGSSLRWSFVARAVSLSAGTKPFRLLPLPGFRRGWALYAPKTGETARIQVGFLGRSARMEVYRRLDFPLLLFAYFLASQIYGESLWPGPSAAKAIQG